MGYFQDLIKESTGLYIPLENDTEVERTKYEICIGSTNRVLKASLEEYDYGDYEIKINFIKNRRHCQTL